MLRKLSISLLASGLMTTAIFAQDLGNFDGMVQLPPPGYTQNQWVDANGCVFIRAGRGGQVRWVPRVTQDRRLFCIGANNTQVNTSSGTQNSATDPARANSPRSLANYSAPVNIPPLDYTERHWVDSNGCVFLRSDRSGVVKWVPRTTRNLEVFCLDDPNASNAQAQALAAAGTNPDTLTSIGQTRAIQQSEILEQQNAPGLTERLSALLGTNTQTAEAREAARREAAQANARARALAREADAADLAAQRELLIQSDRGEQATAEANRQAAQLAAEQAARESAEAEAARTRAEERAQRQAAARALREERAEARRQAAAQAAQERATREAARREARAARAARLAAEREERRQARIAAAAERAAKTAADRAAREAAQQAAAQARAAQQAAAEAQARAARQAAQAEADQQAAQRAAQEAQAAQTRAERQAAREQAAAERQAAREKAAAERQAQQEAARQAQNAPSAQQAAREKLLESVPVYTGEKAVAAYANNGQAVSTYAAFLVKQIPARRVPVRIGGRIGTAVVVGPLRNAAQRAAAQAVADDLRLGIRF